MWGRLGAFISFGEASGYSDKTSITYRYHIGNFIRFLNSLEVIYPEDVTPDQVVAFLQHKRKDCACNGVTVNTYYRAIRSWFNWMVEQNAIDKSPLLKLKTPPIPKTVIKPITADQVQQLLLCCSKYFRGQRDKAIISLLFDSGVRRLELVNIKLDDIDLKQGYIRIMGKGAKERYVAIGKEAKRAIVDYLFMRNDALPWLFVSHLKERRDKLTPDAITLMVNKLMKRAGITGVKLGPHTLRHSFATASIRNGANLFHLQSLLGHSTLNMTRRYVATVDSEEAIKSHKNFSPLDRIRQPNRITKPARSL